MHVAPCRLVMQGMMRCMWHHACPRCSFGDGQNIYISTRDDPRSACIECIAKRKLLPFYWLFIHRYIVQTHRMQLATGTPSGRCEWNFRCCFALELPTLYDDVKVCSQFAHFWLPFSGSKCSSTVPVTCVP